MHSTETAMTKVVSDLLTITRNKGTTILLVFDIRPPTRLSTRPLLFLIFTTPVGKIIDVFWVAYHQYANDMQIYTAVKVNPGSMQSELTLFQDAPSEWTPAQSNKNWSFSPGNETTTRKVW